MIISRFDPREVFVNSEKDLLCFARAESPVNPLNRIVIVLRVIASIYAMTGRQYVPGNSTGIVRSRIVNGYEVIASENLPKALLFSAIGATIRPILKAFMPILFYKMIRKIMLAHSPNTITLTNFIEMIMHPFSASFAIFVGIGIVIFPRIMASFGWVFPAPISRRLIIFLAIGFFPPLIRFSGFISIVCCPLLFTLCCLLWMLLLPLASFLEIAGEAYCIDAAFGGFIFNHFFAGFFEATNAANAGFHDVFLSSHSMLMSAGAGIMRYSGSYSLADYSIIPAIAGRSK